MESFAIGSVIHFKAFNRCVRANGQLAQVGGSFSSIFAINSLPEGKHCVSMEFRMQFLFRAYFHCVISASALTKIC